MSTYRKALAARYRQTSTAELVRIARSPLSTEIEIDTARAVINSRPDVLCGLCEQPVSRPGLCRWCQAEDNAIYQANEEGRR